MSKHAAMCTVHVCNKPIYQTRSHGLPLVAAASDMKDQPRLSWFN